MSQDSVVDLLAELVAFDTTSHRSNLPLIAFVEDTLARHGVASRRVLDDSGEKANLYATIGPADRPGVMLSGHTDTVPVTGQAWSVEPFRLTAGGERLYGRGTADMKGFLAAMLAAVPALVEADLAVPVHLAFSHDEEVGCLGVRSLLADLAHQPVRPAACLVGEPTSMRLATAHKGKLAVRLHVRGKACHSGMAPEGVNAIHAATRLVSWVEETAMAKATRGPFDERFAIPHTTLQVGTIQGGAALNIVPQDCRLDIEIRNVAQDDPEALLGELMAVAGSLEAEMRETSPEAGIRLERLSDYPGLSMADDHALVDFILSLLDERAIERIGYGTEGGLFQRELGIPTLVCGPGSMAQGHQPDEFVTRDQLARCEAFLARLIEALSGPEARRRLAEGEPLATETPDLGA
ncbi:acetylornithine deacetylase [Halomonas stenophila]|uniref:Acetylornithine deacetylase n=1 Tax=Halomonas stenophila TaxID=795312 RepID=A0A7W5EUJ4_9GAMM|nr:acetylornithine deacetylase [Halomonas stenophila]MBB3231001.1 acetylornithine deacetylase [Halomonas stenophila]